MKKEALQLDAWLKDAAPSSELRRWFGHDPAKWQEFQMRYAQELDDKPESWKPLLQAARQGDITLIYSARDEEGEIYQERRIRPSFAASSIFLPFIGQSGFFYASLMSILLETFGSLYFGIRNIPSGLKNDYVEMKFS